MDLQSWTIGPHCSSHLNPIYMEPTGYLPSMTLYLYLIQAPLVALKFGIEQWIVGVLSKECEAQTFNDSLEKCILVFKQIYEIWYICRGQVFFSRPSSNPETPVRWYCSSCMGKNGLWWMSWKNKHCFVPVSLLIHRGQLDWAAWKSQIILCWSPRSIVLRSSVASRT